MRLARGIIGVLLLALGVAAPAQFTSFVKNTRHTQVRLALSHEAARPGDTIMAALELTMSPGWHTYWVNGGDSGDATKILWNLPGDITPGEIQWPLPSTYVDKEADLTTFVYHDRAVLLIPLTIASNAAAGPREIGGLVKWLECEVACVPGSNRVSAALTIGSESKPSAEAALITEAQKKLPSRQLPGRATAKWDAPPNVEKRPLLIEWASDAQEPDFFPYPHSNASVSAKTVVMPTANKVLLRKIVEKTGTNWPSEVHGVLVRSEGGSRAGYEVSLPIAEAGGETAPAGGDKSIWLWLLYAFVGGLILNIMPCVLPVIALKILGFVQQSREQPKRVRTLGILYTLGVVVSFLVLAGIVIGLKAAGQKAGWGIQFSNPQFLVLLTVIVTLVALNLFGVFEVTLGSGAMTSASEAASRHGTAGAFMNGVLATVLATPCTAPFLGAALGFAFAQPSSVIVLFFVTIALGLALPYLVLSWNPRWLKFLPKPGAWMERFKVAMGFPMLATAVWLLSLNESFFGSQTWWLGFLLVIVAAAAWLFGTFVQRGRTGRGVAALLALGLILAGGWWVLESKLEWRSPRGGSQPKASLALAPKGYAWQPWSPAAVQKGLSEARPVIVDFTARWCATCNTIVKPALASDAVTSKLKEVNAVALLADYTLFPPEIGAELERFGRAGVPLVIVYPRDAAKSPLILPEAVTPGMVVNALAEAAK